MKKIGIIPARKGSKGFPNKNTADLGGRPCVEYTIRATIESNIFDSVIVSSNDPKVISIGEALGSQVIVRPEALCQDNSSASEVMGHIIDHMDLKDSDVVCYLQPTSPLRTKSHIKEAMELYINEQVPLISVKKSSEIPYKMFTLENGGLRPLFSDKHTNMRRQDLPTTYLANGAIYIFRVKDFFEAGGFPSYGGVPFVMDATSSIDLDAREDLERIRMEIKRSGYYADR